MDENGLGLTVIQEVIDGLGPERRKRLSCLAKIRISGGHPVGRMVPPSDATTGMADNLLPPETNGSGRILSYHLRMRDHKREAVRAFKSLNYTVYAAGDSYNDTNMLTEADAGFLFNAPDNVIQEFPQFPATRTYGELKAKLYAARATVSPL